MSRKPYQPKRPAEGTWDGYRRKIAIAFEERDFEWIAALANRNKVSFQEQVRRLCLKHARNSNEAAQA